MKHVKNALVADMVTMEPGVAVRPTKVSRSTFSFIGLAALLALTLNSCGLEEGYYEKSDADGTGTGKCKIIQDAIICPCTNTSDTTLIG